MVLFAPINPVQNENPRFPDVICVDPQRGHCTIGFFFDFQISHSEFLIFGDSDLDGTNFTTHLYDENSLLRHSILHCFIPSTNMLPG